MFLEVRHECGNLEVIVIYCIFLMPRNVTHYKTLQIFIIDYLLRSLFSSTFELQVLQVFSCLEDAGTCS